MLELRNAASEGVSMATVTHEVTGRVYEALRAWARDRNAVVLCTIRDCIDCKLRNALKEEMPELLAD